MSTLSPLSGWHILKPITTDKIGSIHLAKQQNSHRATVVASSKGAYTAKGFYVPSQVQEGDTVLYHKLGGNKIDHEGEKLLMVEEKNILAVEGRDIDQLCEAIENLTDELKANG